ncbi:FK506-binding protein 15 isoform X2 [Lepisosteus oculatus]|uniref:FK506-binding protein 15 isoform X2 n=1 Tax=Lepisosteus oculatus TaxID=7918 RepID=UPI00371A67B8
MSAVWDNDYLWQEVQGAKLASLFGMDQAAIRGNESFQYTAPKQPKKASAHAGPPSQKPAPPPEAPAVLLATAVLAFRYVTGQYVKQGKLGAAVLGNHASREYKILLYASQQKQVTSARIHPGFTLTVHPGNYGSFYDDQRQNWSVMFESEKAAMDFCKEVCVAKGNSAPSLDAVVIQDLVLGEGQAVETGDSLEVAYTGWLLQNHAIGQVFDSNVNKDKLLRLKLGAGKVIKGWEEGMVGMKKGGRRLLCVPPSLAYGAQGIPSRIPADSTLVFETEIRRVKFAKDSGTDRLGAGSRDSAAPSPAPSVDSLGPETHLQPLASTPPKPGDLPLRAKSNSLSEQLTNPDATKAKLISRMAKMGQPMLPFLTGAVSSQPDSSDSEMEDPSMSRVKEHPSTAAAQPVAMAAGPPASVQVSPHPLPGVPASSAALLPISMTTAHPQPVMPGSAHAFQSYPYAQSSVSPSQLQAVYPAQTVPYQAPGDITSFLMTEARQYNTEIRLAVGKVADKVDQLASKVDDMQKQGGVSLGLSSMSMETAMIMHNIQRIIQENECLKKEVFEKSARIEEQNRKIGELLNQNQRYVEQSNLLMEQRNDSLKNTSEQNQARVLQAEQDKHALPQELGWDQVRVTEELSAATARVSQLQLEVTSHQQRDMELRSQLSAALQDAEKYSAQISTLQAQLAELGETSARAQGQYRAEKQRRKELEVRAANQEEELQDLRAEKEGLDRALADRKRKWAEERQRQEEELEEGRRSSQQELDHLRAQLRRARTSTDQATAAQMAQLQTDLEAEWQARCDRQLAAAREQHGRQLAELTEQRDGLEQKLAQLQDKLSALKQARDSGEQQLLKQEETGEELQALRDEYSSLQESTVAMRQRLEARVASLERKLVEQTQLDTAGEVKRVMNGVFQSLRGQFDLQETYTGGAVLGVLVNTIKSVTLQLLTKAEEAASSGKSESEGEQEEEVQPPNEEPGEEVQPDEQEQEEAGPKQEVQEREGETHHPDRRLEGENPGREEEEVPKQGTAQPEEEEEEEEELTGGRKGKESGQAIGWQSKAENVTSSQGQGLGEGAEDERLAESPPPLPAPGRESEGEAPEATADPGQQGAVLRPSQGPPTRPAPHPDPLQQDDGETGSARTRVGEAEGDREEDVPFQRKAPTNPPPPPPEEEEDELSLKGRPPPAPLFDDEEDEDDDLNWMS